jgi:colanic acid biosynthesis glycosyl transferase WcaI
VKILLITPFFPPEVGSAAHLYEELGLALHSRGHEVTVLTGLPRYHVVHRGRRSPWQPAAWENHRGLHVLRVFNLDVPWNLPFLRGVDQVISALMSFLGGLCLPPFDIALAYSPPLPLALAGLALGRLRRRPLAVNVQDLFPQSAIDLGILKNRHLIRMFRHLESLLYRQTDLLIVHSRGNRRHLTERGAVPRRVQVIPNWVDTEVIQPRPRQNAYRAALGLNRRFVVSFAGVMGYSQDLETVLESAGLLKDYPKIVFLLVGDGVEKPRLLSRAREEDLNNNVIFLPMQPRDRYPEVLAASDLCLATLRPEVQTPVVPSKILSIMAAGRPVLAAMSLQGDAPRLIDKARCGFCLPPGDAAAMAAAILRFSRNPGLAEQMGANGRQYAVEHFSLTRCVARLEGLLSLVASGPTLGPPRVPEGGCRVSLPATTGMPRETGRIPRRTMGFFWGRRVQLRGLRDSDV